MTYLGYRSVIVTPFTETLSSNMISDWSYDDREAKSDSLRKKNAGCAGAWMSMLSLVNRKMTDNIKGRSSGSGWRHINPMWMQRNAWLRAYSSSDWSIISDIDPFVQQFHTC
jgi:hypothetical protein